MTIAITGANGQLGRLALSALQARTPHLPVVALVRDPAKAADLAVEVRRADYNSPETLPPALEGIETLVLISTSDFRDRLGQHRNVIAAARASGVQRLIYTSILKGHDSPLALAADHKATETAIEESGLASTILRNGWYTENYTASVPAALQAGAFIGSAGKGRISGAARVDFAEAIAVTAAAPEHAGRIHELAGDQAFTLEELAAEVSRQTGAPLPYNDLPQAAYAGILEGLGLPAAFAAMVSDADAHAAEGALFDDSGTLGRLIGRPTTPMAESLRIALAA